MLERLRGQTFLADSHSSEKPDLTLHGQGIKEDNPSTSKETRLPRSVRAYIRRLKADGKWEEAMKVAQNVRDQKERNRQHKAKEELNRTIGMLLSTDDPQIESELEIRAIWLLEAAGVIDSRERLAELLGTIESKAPQLQNFLEGRLAIIRDLLQPFMPPAVHLSKKKYRR